MIIAIDFDGTLVENKFPEIGEDREHSFYFLKIWQQQGHKLILWTCRTGIRLDEAVNYCRLKGIEFDAVNENVPDLLFETSSKIYADWYIDDRSNNMRVRFPELAKYSKIAESSKPKLFPDL